MKKSLLRKLIFYLSLSFVIFLGIDNIIVYAQQKSSSPIFEDVSLTANFVPDPMTLRGISGGFVPAKELAGRGETVTGSCMGFMDEKPDHKITLTSFFEYLSIQVKGSEDTTLMIRGPGGTWCNDDYEGNNPGIVGQWFSGTYELWVGSYEKNQYIPYIIRISQRR